MKNYIVRLKVAGAFLLGTLLSPSVHAQDSPADNLERKTKQDFQRIVQQTGVTIQVPAQTPPQGTTTSTQPAGKTIAAAGEPEKVAIYVDGIELWRSVYSAVAIREQILRGPWATRPSNYLINDSPLDAALRPIYHVQEGMTFNGDLTDAKQLRLAVDALKETITKHSGARVDLITHSLGTVIAYTALAELATAGETQPDVTISKPNVTNFITLGSPLGREAILVKVGAPLAGLNIPLPSSIKTPRVLNIQGRWLNVFHDKDLIGDKIQAFGVINVALQGSDAFLDASGESSAHSFPYQGLESIRLIADVIRGNHARLSDIAANVPTAPQPTTSGTPAGDGTNSNAAGSIDCNEPTIKPGMSGRDGELALGPAKNWDRYNAIVALVAGGKFRSPLCANELALILKETTGDSRARSIAGLANLIKSELSGRESATILGSAQELAEWDRYNAIAALAKAKKFNSSLTGEEMAMMLEGATGDARARAIAEWSAK